MSGYNTDGGGSMKNLNQLALEVHEANAKWWTDLDTGQPIDRNKGELLLLMVSELSEAMEGERKDLMDDKLPHRKCAEVEMADVVIRTLDFAGGFGLKLKRHEDEPDLVDGFNIGETLLEMVACITEAYFADNPYDEDKSAVEYWLSLLVTKAEKYCEGRGYDLWGAYDEKMEFNKTRPDHSLEARRATGGKKW